VTLYLAVYRKRRRQALFLVTSAVVGLVVNNVAKALVGRTRPQFDGAVVHEFGNSFPSGHAMNSTVVYGSLVVLIWSLAGARRTRIASLVAATTVVAAIATSRVVLEVHYMSDVIAGIVLGTALVLASAAAFTTWQHEGGQLPTALERAPSLNELVEPASSDEW
jgi:membrane-associated phospholipid phosphatase